MSRAIFGVVTLLGGASQAFATSELSLGTADFAVLSAAPYGGGAVTCTDSTIWGDVGSSGPLASVTQTNCTITGAIVAPVSQNVINDFNRAYNTLANEVCDYYLTSLAGQVLEPGTYCFTAASTTTDGVLILNGDANDSWLFKIGTSGTGALTGTNFEVVMANDAQACNVTWLVAEAVTMTTSGFNGVILAGAAITMTGGEAESLALAKAAVTLTGVDFLACDGVSIPVHQHAQCNQGVGNGTEGCDPGNSNQGNPARSNDELGGTPGNPGRNGGNGK